MMQQDELVARPVPPLSQHLLLHRGGHRGRLPVGYDQHTVRLENVPQGFATATSVSSPPDTETAFICHGKLNIVTHYKITVTCRVGQKIN